MTTRFIGIKELRQNMAKISKQMLQKGERLIVLRKNKPIFELRPLKEGEVYLESFKRDIEEARKSVRAGEVYTHEKVRKLLGL